MRVDWIIPCRYAEIHDGTATIVGAGIERFNVPAFPAKVPLVLVVRLTGPQVTGPTDVHLASRILDPNMQPVGEVLEVTFQVTPNTPAPSEVEGQSIFAVKHTFAAPLPGLYTVSVEANGRGETVCIRVVPQ